jgi:hypothetical protein
MDNLGGRMEKDMEALRQAQIEKDEHIEKISTENEELIKQVLLFVCFFPNKFIT